MNKLVNIIKMAGTKTLGLFSSAVIVVALILFSLPFLRPKNDTDEVFFSTASGNVSFDVEIADSSVSRALGLMGRDKMPESAGMLFVFRDEDTVNFWMKSTLMPLDMIFIKGDGEVAYIEKNAQPCKTLDCELYGSRMPVRYVVEINGGLADRLGINVGDKFDYESLNVGGVIVNGGDVLVIDKNGYGRILPRVRVNGGVDLAEAGKKMLSDKYGIKGLELVTYLGQFNRYGIGKGGADDKTESKVMNMFLFTTQQREMVMPSGSISKAIWVKKEDVPGLLTNAKSREFFKSIAGKI